MSRGTCAGAVAVALALSGCQGDRAAAPLPTRTPVAVTTTPATASPVPPPALAPDAEPAWLPPPWTRQSATRSAPLAAARPEYLFCDWPGSAPSRVVDGARTAVTEQVLTHPSGLRARLLRYETELAGGVSNLMKFAYDSCLRPGKATSLAGPRTAWVYRGVAGAADLGAERDLRESRVLRVAEIRGASAGRRPTRDDALAALTVWASAP